MTDGEQGVQASRELVLPSRELHGVWENLIFDEGIKEKLLRYVNTGKNSQTICLYYIGLMKSGKLKVVQNNCHFVVVLVEPNIIMKMALIRKFL